MMKNESMGLIVGVWLTRDKTRLRKAFRNIGTFSLSLAMLGQTILLAGNSRVVAQGKYGGPRSTAKESRDSGSKESRGLRQHATPTGAEIQTQDVTTSTEVPGQSIAPVQVSIVNFQQLAEMKSQRPVSTKTVQELKPAPGIIQEPETPASPKARTSQTPADSGGPSIPSPAPSSNFLAQEDGPKVGTTTFTIPPDTQGAVGIDKIFSNTNQNYRIQDKTTGAALSTVNSDTFWASSGGSGFFDPRIVFDPYNQRWILAIVSNMQTATSSVEVAVSQTSDPSGSYFLFRFIVGCANGSPGCAAGGEWADFPMLGFNKNWVAISMNMFSISTSVNNNFRTLVLNYPQFRTGVASGVLFVGAGIGFCNHPAETYDATQNTLFLANHLSSSVATYRLSTITGTPSAPSFSIGATQTRPGGGWTQPGGDILPQNCVPGSPIPTFQCPVTLRRIDVTDAQVRGNVVYRNGKVYYAQNIQLPAGGTVASSHVAAQWTVLDSSLPIGVVNPAMFVDGGRIEDPTATFTNTGKHYAYPSVAVNRNDDMLLGFSQYATDQFASAGYALRLHGDAVGTTRDPFIYKAGEDYYEKTFSGTRNRWGDYSATRIDPVNDRDMWTVQEYAQQRVGSGVPPQTGLNSNDSRWGTWWAKLTLPAGPNDLKISEFRTRGSVDTDEYVEIYNNSDAPLTVTTLDGSAGYALAASDGVVRFTIPTGTIIPGRGHYLGVNSVGYGLATYPAGNGTTATGDATFITDIPDNAGIALFNTATPASFSIATRLDAVGSTAEANALYKEGAGYPPVGVFVLEDAIYRDTCGKGGSTTILGACPTLGFPKDTDNNASDFIFADTNGAPAGFGQRLGAPGPKNLSSPVQRNDTISAFLLDSTVGATSPPNRVRDFTSDPPNNSTFGTLDIRRRFTNNNPVLPVTRLRFRVVDISTFPVPGGFADLRARTSSAVVVIGVNDPVTCPGGITPCIITVQGTTLETPPLQPNGGGFNSSLSAGTVVLATPLAPGASINLRFLLGLQQTGTFKFFVNIEALP